MLGITASPQEYQNYVQLVTGGPQVLRYYNTVFGDIYLLNEKLLPTFDVVTLFHLCEFRSSQTDAYGGLTDLAVTNLLTDKTRPGGHILFYTGSVAFAKPSRSSRNGRRSARSRASASTKPCWCIGK